MIRLPDSLEAEMTFADGLTAGKYQRMDSGCLAYRRGYVAMIALHIDFSAEEECSVCTFFQEAMLWRSICGSAAPRLAM